MPQPSPFLLHDWLAEWWRIRAHGATMVVHLARRNGVLVGAAPLMIRRQKGVRVLEFIGGRDSALADLLLADPADTELAAVLTRRIRAGSHDVADLFGLRSDSVLLRQLAGASVHTIERVESPVLDLSRGWDEVYKEKTNAKRRNLHRRRRRQLSELGDVEIEIASAPDAILAELDDAVHLHELRWSGRPDGSGFATAEGRRFYEAALARLAADDVVRLLMMRVGGRAAAFHLYFALGGSMYVHRLAFDPELGRFSPGVIATLAAIEAASAEGLTRVEFLGGDERYKVELADGFEPMNQALGLARTPRGHAYAHLRMAAIRSRRRLKRSPRIHTFYFETLASTRRRLGRARRLLHLSSAP